MGRKYVTYVTRDNGDVGEGEASPYDIREAQNIAKRVRKELGRKVTFDLEPVDEWVSLTIKW